MTIDFYSFAKKINSTALPTGSPILSISASLKDESGIINPVLQIGFAATFAPALYNYCHISDYGRYYFIDDWTFRDGYWEAACRCDVLGSWKTDIGNATKYVIRSAYNYNPRIIDDFYPATFDEAEIALEYDFGFDIDSGDYVIGVVNRQDTNVGGMVSFYRMTQATMDEMRRAMYPTPSDYFEDITLITGDVLRSIIDPWQYLISCKRFPISIPHETLQSNITFGQWASNGSDRMIGWRLSGMTDWGSLTHDFTIASDWLGRDARERSAPGTHIFVVCNPWGAVELSPSDFSASSVIRLEILPDFVTGDGILKIYAVKGPLQTLVAQRTARLGVDTTIAASHINALGGVTQGIGAIANAVGGNFVGALSGAATASQSLTPSLSGATALQEGMVSLEGVARVIVKTPKYPGQDVAEHGRPLYYTAQLSTLPGYLKLADGDFEATGCMQQELERIGEFFTSGFYYE